MAAYLYPLMQMEYAGQREVEGLEAQLESLQRRNHELRDEVDLLKTPAGVEQAARQSLGYVKPGENAYVVVDANCEEATATPVPEAEAVLAEAPVPWWQRILDLVFGVRS